MQDTEQKPIKMGTNWVWSWIDSYQWLIDGYTTDGWKNGGQWYFIRLKSGHQIYGRDTEDGGSCCVEHEDWVIADGWDISEAIPELVGEYFYYEED
jgi:hypothetical protein